MENKRKVLLLADSNMSLSGVPVVYMSIVRLLHTQFDFDIIIFKDDDMHFEKEFLSYGGKIFKYSFNKPKSLFKKIIWLNYSFQKNVKAFLNKIIKLSDYSIIHSFQELYCYPFIKEAKKAGIQTRILHINVASSAYPSKNNPSQIFYRWYQKKSKRLCTNIVFVSNDALKYNDYKNKGVVIYNTFDEQKYNKMIECSHQNMVLTQIGTFSSRKNQLFSLRLVASLKKYYKNIKLNIVGKEIDSNYLLKMERFISNNSLNNNVVFLGTSPDIEQLFKKTSYVLFPSISESFGLVLLEAQSCGIHCFSSSSIPKDADLGNVDFIKLDEKEWANNIIDYFTKNGNKRKIPVGIEKYTQEAFIKNLLKVYNNKE